MAFAADAALGAVPGAPTAGAIVLNGGALRALTTTSLATNRSIALGPPAAGGTGTLDVTNAFTLTVPSTIANNGGVGNLIKNGAGTLILAKADAYTGLTVVSNGVLRFATNHDTSLTRVTGVAAGAVAESAGVLNLKVNLNGSVASTNVTGPGTLRLIASGTSASTPDIFFGPDHVSTSFYGARINAGTLDLGSSQRFIHALSGHNSVARWRDREDARIDSSIVGSGGITYIAQMTWPDLALPMEVPLVLAGSNTFTGPLEIQRGSIYLLNPQALARTNKVLLNPADGNSARLFIFGNGATIKDLESTGPGEAFIANGNINNNFSNTPAATLTVQQTVDTTFAGLLMDSHYDYDGTGGFTSGTLSLIKNGPAKLTLSGANTYFGTTLINAGILSLGSSGSIANTPLITITPGASLDASGTTFNLAAAQTLTAGRTAGFATDFNGTLNSAGTINVAGSGIKGTMTVAGDLNLHGGTLVIDLANTPTAGAGVNDLIVASGALSLSGVTTITPNFVNGGLAAGTYTLIQAGSLTSGDTNNLALVVPTGGRQLYTLDTTTVPGRVLLQVSGSIPGSLIWAGTNGNTWDSTVINWRNGLIADKFFNGDQVTFNDSATNGFVDIVGTVQPYPMIVSNSARPYVISGAGNISGPGGLIKNGNGTVTIVADNNYAGLTTINAGTVQVGTNGTTGSLGPSAITNNGTLIFDRGDSPTVANDISGGGQVSNIGDGAVILTGAITGGGSVGQSGAGSLALAGANTYTGPTTVSGGTLVVGSSGALGNSAAGTTVAPGGTLDVNGFDVGAEVITAGGDGVGGQGAIVNNGALQIQATHFVTLTANTTVGANNRWDIRANPTATLSTGGNPYKLTKVGGNQFTLVAVAVDPMLGDVDVQQGMFSFELTTTSLGNPANQLIVQNGATFQLWQATNQLNKVITLNNGGTLSSGSGNNTVVGPVTLIGNNTITVPGTTLTINGTIGGAGSLTKDGANTLTLTASNIYTGGTTINAGILAVANSNAVGPADVTVNGGALHFSFPSGTTNVFTNNVILPGVAANSFWILGAPTNQTTVRLTGVISGGTPGVDYNLVDSGVGLNHFNCIVLSNPGNTFQGNIYMDRGTLAFTSDAALGDPANGIGFDTWNLIGQLRFDADNITLNAGRTITLSPTGDNTKQQPFNVQSYTGTIAGPIVGAGQFVKQGPGKLILTGASSYTGATTVSEGKLVVNGSLASGTATTVQTNAALGGTGTLAGTVTVQGGGAFDPGASIGTLNTGNETWSAGARYNFELNSPTSSAGWDKLNVTGTINVQSSSVNPFIVKLVTLTGGGSPGSLAGFDPAASYSWTIATASGGILNFAANKFTVDTTSFGNSFTGSFSVGQSGNSLVVNYSPVSTPPVVNSFGRVTGGFQVTFSGTSGQTYKVLSSTNAALPLNLWSILSSGTFGASPVSYTNTPLGDPQRFYIIGSP